MLELMKSFRVLLIAASASAAVEHATFFTAEEFSGYTVLKTTHSDCGGREYVLYPRGTTQPSLGAASNTRMYVETPIQKVILAETVPQTFLETLGVRDTIVSASQYSTSSCLNSLVESSSISAWAGTGDAAVLETAAATAEFIVTSPYAVKNWDASVPSAAKLICDATSYELSPLASAEWFKFYGYLFGKTAEASSAYCHAQGRYECNAALGSSLQMRIAASYSIPKVIFVAKNDYSSWGGDVFYQISQPPYLMQYVIDAGGAMVDMSAYSTFKDGDTGNYKFPIANDGTVADLASFHAALGAADIIIDQTYPNMQQLADLQTNYKVAQAAPALKAFTNGQIYTLDGVMSLSGGSQSAYGGTDWFSSRFAEPDTVLEDLISILHPQSNTYRDTAWTLKYLRHVGDGDNPTFISSSMCADVTAAHEPRATKCEVIRSKATSGILLHLTALQQSTCNADYASSSSDDDDGGLATEAKIAIGVSAAVAIVATIVLIVVFMKEQATNTAVFAGKASKDASGAAPGP